MVSEQQSSERIENVQTDVQNTMDNTNIYTDTHETESHHEDHRSIEELVSEMENLVNKKNVGTESGIFNRLKNLVLAKINEEIEDKKYEHENEEGKESFSWEHPVLAKVTTLNNIFKGKYAEFLQQQEEEYAKNLEIRKNIIEKLKGLYTNTEPGTNLFKAIREIKELWANAGKVTKSQIKLINNDYFHHLNQFYAMLDLNKEFLEQEYSHNLEKRQHIINRAKELEHEQSIQKALNELQYLHKLWKEEAEPVAEEFRETTWEEFKEISNRIHSRKTELTLQIETEQKANLEKKNNIIAEIQKLANSSESDHNHWQQAIKKVERLREEFLKLGSVPKKLSSQNWIDFKQTLRKFNSTKNEFYKSMKGSQVDNLERKLQLIQTAKDNVNSEDWDTVVPLFKKLQDEWRNIGHVPRSQANKIWEEFCDICNVFFDNYRAKTNTDNWKENYKQKKTLLEELKAITEEGSVEKIESIKSQWNAIGKVPRNKISINSEFNKVLKEKLKLNKITEFDIKDENLSESQLTDKARRIKNQISDLENEITTLENNLGFFSNPTRENPLLKDTYAKIDEKRELIESLKLSLHQMITV